MPVCTNCGSEEFLWTDAVRTGSLTRSSLALRPGGELALGARLCRGCGHADLFVKDVAILRDPQRWSPGEFVVVPPGTPSHLVPPPWLEPPPPPRPTSTAVSATPAERTAPGAEPVLEPAPTAEPKRTPRRRSAPKAKGEGPPLIHD